MVPNKVYFLICAGALLTFSACAPGKGIYGSYHQPGMSPNSLKLVLREDHSFSLEGWNDIMGNSTRTGTWLLQKDTLLLEATAVSGSKISTEEKQTGTGTLAITVVDESGAGIAGADIWIDGKKKNTTDTDGRVHWPAEEIHLLRVRYLSLDQEVQIKNSRSDDIRVRLYLTTDINAGEMTHQKWLHSGTKLVPVEGGKALPQQAFEKMR
ncbi:peptidase associated/transthyretin-like domain-containing protein [Pararcticibacter amylolyticus]|uniref:Uncharacterized protein n=1 Tax=Pararcticibacter amylolyticus TaxID=2173175 RepID=A0A2U2PK09_9SPHI|nr:hypothetical protein [Pararcticibacter amylolyticus]PWG81604.1 hypothetical protein DDR33_07170 [Pararcticibacter amylolyticus]